MRLWDISIRNPVFITMIMLALVVAGRDRVHRHAAGLLPRCLLPDHGGHHRLSGRRPRRGRDPGDQAHRRGDGHRAGRGRGAVAFQRRLLDGDRELQPGQGRRSVALQEVREKIANVRSDLPDDVLEPTVTAYDPSSLPILRISVAIHRTACGPVRRSGTCDRCSLDGHRGCAAPAAAHRRRRRCGRDRRPRAGDPGLAGRQCAQGPPRGAPAGDRRPSSPRATASRAAASSRPGRTSCCARPATSTRSKTWPTCRSPRRSARCAWAISPRCRTAGRSKTPTAGWTGRRPWSSPSASSRARTPCRWPSG